MHNATAVNVCIAILNGKQEKVNVRLLELESQIDVPVYLAGSRVISNRTTNGTEHRVEIIGCLATDQSLTVENTS